jgi:hypothetical protein
VDNLDESLVRQALDFSPVGNIGATFTSSSVEPVTGGASGREDLFALGCVFIRGGLAGLLGVRASGHTQQCERQGGQERNW